MKQASGTTPVEPGSWEKTLQAVRVPGSVMIGSSSRFTNIYVPKPETILLDEERVEEQSATIRIQQGKTRALSDYRTAGRKAALRATMERAIDGHVMNMGTSLVYDARWVYNGNLAHLVGHHLGRLGYVKDELGIGPGDCTVVLEKDSPSISHRLLNMVGYETVETNRVVAGNVLEVDIKRFEPYQLIPWVHLLEPPGISPTGIDKLYIGRRSSRRISNEEEIEDILTHLGYQTHYFEDISLETQWALVRDASSIVSIHGAALGYLSTKGVGRATSEYELLEIFSPGLVADIFRKTSAVIGGRWVGCRGKITSEFVKGVEESDRFKAFDGLDFYLDPRALECAFQALRESQINT